MIDETTTASALNWRAFLRPWLESGDRMNPLLVVPLLEAMDTEIGQLQAAARAVAMRMHQVYEDAPYTVQRDFFGDIDDEVVAFLDTYCPGWREGYEDL